ncbi:1-phosphofructokinase [Pectinatus brassicae]|uniref:Tagatose-6-phosphate kinase n=1 Tax=Pectinatus brassicae TaxID=862415 RepID=A0A840ULD4_9FIRM|nr:1-phosphofructokinase [Pectinatus brassicae]MBB5335518.1 tagatose 6-phosphate kinase [Pectinatus brassicae]
MILVVNLNPSLDKIYNVDTLEYGQVMRTNKVQNTAGGKGTHVANVISILGGKCIVTGFLGGHIGAFIRGKLEKQQIINKCIHIEGETRSCLNIATIDGKQTEILEPGPIIKLEERNAFIQQYKELLKEVSLVVASGSLPQNLGSDFYQLLIELANDAGKRFLLDTSGEAFEKSLLARPFFIKPNKDEIESFTGRKIETIEDVVGELKTFIKKGIMMPTISLGKKGAVIAYNDKFYHVQPPVLEAVNAVGSGDAYVAGLAIGLDKNLSIEEIISLAAACGTANVLEAESGFVDINKVDNISKNINIELL